MRRSSDFFLLAAILLSIVLGGTSPVQAGILYDWTAASGQFPNQVATSTGYAPVTLNNNSTPEVPVLSGGALTLSTDQYVENMYYSVPLTATGNGAALGTLPLSVEFSLKLGVGGRSDTRRGSVVLGILGGNSAGNGLQIYPGEIFVSNGTFSRGASAAVTTDDAFHTYRVDLSGYTAGSGFSVYVDNALKLTGTLYSSTTDNGAANYPNIEFYFGEGSSLAFGTSQFQSFRISTVPEPSTWALVVLAAGAGVVFARRRYQI